MSNKDVTLEQRMNHEKFEKKTPKRRPGTEHIYTTRNGVRKCREHGPLHPFWPNCPDCLRASGERTT